jgi:hypothetical protein
MAIYRKQYAAGKLSQRVIDRLEAIPGWKWDDTSYLFPHRVVEKLADDLADETLELHRLAAA